MKVKVMMWSSGSAPDILGSGFVDVGTLGGVRVFTCQSRTEVIGKNEKGEYDTGPSSYVQFNPPEIVRMGAHGREFAEPYAVVHPETFAKLDKKELASELQDFVIGIRRQLR